MNQRPSMANACEKWKDDSDYVWGYKSDSARKVMIRKIIKP